MRNKMRNRALKILYRLYKFYFKNKKKEIECACNEFYHEENESQKARILKDMSFWYVKRNISPKQYYEQSFDKLSDSAKKGMLPNSELVLFDRQYNPQKDIHIVGNKYECYERFKEYYGRECVLVKDPTTKDEAFEDFCLRRKKFVVKPLYNDSGVGVRLFTFGESDMPTHPFIAEEIIIQSEALARFHPWSVNTLRINTIRCREQIVIWQCILRFGRKENMVDNAHFGGVFSVIDNEGNAIAAGDVHRNKYNVHPDTGTPIVGFKVPDWEQACVLVRDLATKVGGLRFIGWDLAHTDKGWIIVEANTAPGILPPMVTGVGVAKEFYDIKRKM